MMDQVNSHWRRLRAVDLPRRLAWAEGLLYAATIVWLLRLIAGQLEGFSLGSLVLSCGFLVMQLALIGFAIRGRNYGACWWLLAFCFGWLFFGLVRVALDSSMYGWQPLDPVFPVLRLIQAALECLGLALLFSRRGRRWFDPGATHARSGHSSAW
jgi:hypothetical protein